MFTFINKGAGVACLRLIIQSFCIWPCTLPPNQSQLYSWLSSNWGWCFFPWNWFYKKCAYFKNSDFRQIIQNWSLIEAQQANTFSYLFKIVGRTWPFCLKDLLKIFQWLLMITSVSWKYTWYQILFKKEGLSVFYTWGLKIVIATYLVLNTRGQKCCLSRLLSYSCIFLVCRHVLLWTHKLEYI